MKTAGIIAEYNPFHNGHKALIDAAKSAGYTHFVAVMSGNFVQRASPAITEKRVRTKAAIKSGIDLVIELPVSAATETAKKFAYAAVYLLKQTGIIDGVVFGTEQGDLETIKQIVSILDDKKTDHIIQFHLEKGFSFAKARGMAIGDRLGIDAEKIIEKPNNILGIEYLSAMKKLEWSPGLFTIPRISVDHHSTTPQGQFASASYLRSVGDNPTNISDYLPDTAKKIYTKALNDGLYPAQYQKLELALLSHLRRLSKDDLCKLPNISEGIENRLFNAIKTSVSFDQLISNLQTKRYPMSRVTRLVLHAFLDISDNLSRTLPPYIRILGISSKGQKLLSLMKISSKLPFSHSFVYLEKINDICKKFVAKEVFSTDIYTLSLPKPLPCGYEYTSSAIFEK